MVPAAVPLLRGSGAAVPMRGLIVALLLSLGVGASSSAFTQESAAALVTLQPGDLLNVQIWREPDLSGDFLIDETGRVVLPLLGELQVVGLPIHQVRDLLLAEYRVQLRNPSIAITPLRRIHVLGEVNKPGLLAVDPTVTLAAVVALAGGASPTGDLNRIRLIRGDTVIHERVATNQALTTVGIRSGDHILVDRRSWVDRNSAFLISAGLTVPSVIASVIILLRR